MILNTYEEIVRHFDKFSDKKLYLHCVDDAIHEIKNVQYTSRGLEVKIKDGKYIIVSPSNKVFNNLTEKEWYGKIKSKEKKVKKNKKS